MHLHMLHYIIILKMNLKMKMNERTKCEVADVRVIAVGLTGCKHDNFVWQQCHRVKLDNDSFGVMSAAPP